MTASVRQRGFSLIEMVVFVTSVTTLLMLVAMLIQRMLRLDRDERARLVVASAVERLGRDLRSDAHAAVGPVERSDAKLVVPLPGGRAVEYLVREADILRTVREAGKATHFEPYARPTGTRARFESTSDGPRSLVVLRFDLTEARPGDPVFRGYRIEAATGRSARGREVSP